MSMNGMSSRWLAHTSFGGEELAVGKGALSFNFCQQSPCRSGCNYLAMEMQFTNRLNRSTSPDLWNIMVTVVRASRRVISNVSTYCVCGYARKRAC